MGVDKMPMLGTGKIDYPAVQHLAETRMEPAEAATVGLLTGVAMRWPLRCLAKGDQTMSDLYARYTRLR